MSKQNTDNVSELGHRVINKKHTTKFGFKKCWEPTCKEKIEVVTSHIVYFAFFYWSFSSDHDFCRTLKQQQEITCHETTLKSAKLQFQIIIIIII